MTDEIAIVSSSVDPASINIEARLRELACWMDRGDYLEHGRFRLVRLDGELIKQKDLDYKIASMGIDPRLVVFASRHKAKKGVPWLGGHFTGIVGQNEDESQTYGLSRAAPTALKSFLQNLKRVLPEGYLLSAEATHHGPVDMNTPSFFAEIGSTQNEWENYNAAKSVAMAILGIEEIPAEVFVGFGGGHYVQRQTEIIFGTNAAFGHMFSNYQVESLDIDSIRLAVERSNASFAYLDKKSLRSAQKAMITEALNRLGLEVLRGRDIKARFPLDMR